MTTTPDQEPIPGTDPDAGTTEPAPDTGTTDTGTTDTGTADTGGDAGGDLTATDTPDQVPAPETGGDPTSPAIEGIDDRQVAANNLTSTPDDDDTRDQTQPDRRDNPALPNDISNVVDPSDPMTLTGHDAQPGESGA